MEIVLKILEAVATVIIAYFSIGFILIWRCWPVNDDQNQAPFWVLGRLIAKPFKLLWKGLRGLFLWMGKYF